MSIITDKNGEKVSKEAHAYTPGLKIKRSTSVSKIRKLPIKGNVYVKIGEIVDYDTIVADAMMSGNPEIVKMSQLLNVEPEDIHGYMKKKVGENVKEGEIIAGYNTLFGLIKKEVLSPCEGTIETISESTGQVIIRGPPIPLEVNAYIPGKVTKILPNEGAIIETNAVLIQGICGVGGETHGKIKIAVNSPDEELTKNHISYDDKGKVLIGGSMMTIEALRKAIEVGVSCIVAGGIRPNDLRSILGEDIGVAITGHEELGLSLIITEGFGKMSMSQRTFDLLQSYEGYLASVNGATQIRAGVLRPEIIIPHEESEEKSTSDKLISGIIPGTNVRIIRNPHFGAIGKIVRLPVELQQLKSRSYVRVVDVELSDGSIVMVPRANVEIIEE